MTVDATLPDNLEAWLDYIDRQHHQSIAPGLDRIGKVADTLGLTKLPSKIILVGGTNGKGTTSRFLEAYLSKQHYSVGLFTSPYLLHYRESVRLNGCVLVDSVHSCAFNAIEQQRGETGLTAFEFSTLAALKIFRDKAPDFIILEVGLGGREDATNIVEPDISVITTVGIDHQSWLGDDREAIGWQKAGIFRAGKAAVIGDFDIPQSMLDYAQQLNTRLVCANEDFSLRNSEGCWHWQSGEMQLNDLILPKIPQQNVSTALAVLQQLDIELNRSGVNSVLSSLVVEGRLQVINDSPLIIVDVAHNPQAAAYLARQLKKYLQQGYHRISAVVGMLADKDIEQTLDKVSDLIGHWYLADLSVSRAATAVQLAQSLEKLGIDAFSCYDSVAKGFAQAKAGQRNDEMIIVFGSFHTVAAVMPNISDRYTPI